MGENASSSLPAAILPVSSELREAVIEPVLKNEEVRADANTLIYVNSEDALLVGGPSLHPGLTRRKNAIDTYGGYSRGVRPPLSAIQSQGWLYRKLAAYGQMGRSDMDLPWEKTEKASALGEFKT